MRGGCPGVAVDLWGALPAPMAPIPADSTPGVDHDELALARGQALRTHAPQRAVPASPCGLSSQGHPLLRCSRALHTRIYSHSVRLARPRPAVADVEWTAQSRCTPVLHKCRLHTQPSSALSRIILICNFQLCRNRIAHRLPHHQ
jgi:hypothetical protein